MMCYYLFFSVASNVLALLDDDDIVTNCEITPHILLYVFHEIDIDVTQTSFPAIIALIDGGPVVLLIYYNLYDYFLPNTVKVPTLLLTI